MGPKTKVTKPATPTPPTIDDTTSQQEDALDQLLRRRGRASTALTGAGGAPLSGSTSASQLLGL